MRNYRERKRKDEEHKNPSNEDVHKIIQAKSISDQIADKQKKAAYQRIYRERKRKAKEAAKQFVENTVPSTLQNNAIYMRIHHERVKKTKFSIEHHYSEKMDIK